VSKDNLKFQEFFIRLIAEFPEMPRTAMWMHDYGTYTFAFWGQVDESQYFAKTHLVQSLGERTTRDLGIGDFIYSVHVGKQGVFIVASIDSTFLSLVFDKIDSIDATLPIIKEVLRKMLEHQSQTISP
jgi:hypothetical protein